MYPNHTAAWCVSDAERQLVLQQHPTAALQRAEDTAHLPHPITGLHTPEVGVVTVALAGISAEAERLQVADVVRAALILRDDVVHLQGPLMFMGAATLAAAPCPGEHSVLHRTADRAAVAGMMGEHLLTPLLAEPVQPLTAPIRV